MPPLPRQDLLDAMRRIPDVWHDFAGATVFMTGGTGFIGTWMVELMRTASQMLGLGTRLILLTRDPKGERLTASGLDRAPDVTLIAGNVRRPLSWNGPITHVVHAATDASAKLNNENPLEMIDTVVDGTRQVLNSLSAWLPRRFLYVSSGAVYGNQSPLQHVTEDYRGGPDPLDARSAYGEGKRMAEQLCAIYARRLNATHMTIARCFSFVGPLLPLDTHFAIGNFIADGIAGRNIHITGNGTCVRSYMYAADLAAWMWAVMIRGQHLRAYNVGADDAYDMRNLATIIAAHFTPPARVQILGTGTASESVYVPSNARARSELGLDVWTDLPHAIDRTIAWHSTEGL
jgi:nucleoside-diphosphate-sugar epimerase